MRFPTAAGAALLKRLLLVLLLIVAVLAAGEAALRASGAVNLKGVERTMFALDRPWGGYGNRPGGSAVAFGQRYDFDADGFRRFTTDAPRAAARPMLLIGDSVAFSTGVAQGESLGARLAALRGAAVIDASVIGYAAEDEERVLRHLLASGFAGDIVVVVCLNDIDTGSRAAIEAFLAGAPTPDGWLRRVNDALRDRSALYLALRGLVFDSRRRYYEADAALYADPARVAALTATVARMATAAQGHRLLFAVAPYAHQMSSEATDAPDRVLAAAFAAADTRAIFLRDTFRAAPRDAARLYLWDDPMHTSVSGVRLMAETIAAALDAAPR